MEMRRRGVVFKSFKDIDVNKDNAVAALAKVNENMKLVLEMLADLRVNTSDDPKKLGEGRRDSRPDKKR